MLEVKESSKTTLFESLLGKKDVDDAVKVLWKVNYRGPEYAGQVDVEMLKLFLEQQ